MLILSPYVEDIEKNNWATNISKETLGIAKEYRKYLNMTSRESIKNLNERLQKKDPSLGIYSALALFSLIDFTGLGLGFMHPAKLEGKDYEMFMNQLAAACTTVPEKGLFLHKLITYWDDKMKSNSENSVGQEIMFITFRNILDLWKQDEDVILATVDRRGRSLLSLVVKYAIPGFSSKIANYDYSRQDLTGSRLSPQIAKIEDKRCCLIS